MQPSAAVTAANDNTPPRRPSRAELLRMADAILRANPKPKEPTVRIRYRGTRPAMRWLEKHDAQGAAALWLFARDRLPPEAANDNHGADA